MLTPEYLRDLPEEMVALYSEAELKILADMARRVSSYQLWIPAAEHQRRMLLEAGRTQDEILSALTSLTHKTRQELTRLMQGAAKQTLGTDAAAYTAAGIEVPAFSASEPLKRILNAGYKATLGEMRNLCRTTARLGARQFTQVLDSAWMQVQSGAIDLNSAVRSAVKQLSEAGLRSVRYDSGRTDSLEVAVRRATQTGVNQTCCQLQEELADEVGCDLVEVSAHAGARPSHALWQGKIYSRSGKSDKYPDFRAATGYGTGAGLGGWNCAHSFGAYVEGAPRVYTKEQLAEMDAPKYEYGGKKLTEYEAQQEQRKNEREIRRWKREYAAMDAAGQDTTEAAVKLKAARERQTDFLNKTGLKRQSDREQMTSFGRSQAARAGSEARAYEKALAEKKKYDTIAAELKATGAIQKTAIVHFTPQPIDVDGLGFDDNHINRERRHQVTEAQAKDYIRSAKVSVTVWGGRYERYYSYDGAAYVDKSGQFIRTAYPAERYDEKTTAFMEVLKKHGILPQGR